MRILFATWPASSHLYPLVPLAWALQSAGHDVRVASLPALRAGTAAVGLTPVTLRARTEGGPASAVSARSLDRVAEALPMAPGERHLWEFFRHRVVPPLAHHYPSGPGADGGRAVVDELVDFARSWRPGLVLWDPAFLAAPVAAASCGAAHARLLWGPDYFGWLHARTAALRDLRDLEPEEDLLARFVEPMLSRLGLERDETMFLGQWTIDPAPPRMRLPLRLRSMALRPIPYQRVAEVPSWLARAPRGRRVCLTMGLFAQDHDPGIPIAQVMEAVSELDAEVVATLKSAQTVGVGTVPDNVRVVEYVPLNALLSTCSAIAHHGGFGTFVAAADQRVPQLITSSLSAWDSGVTESGAYVAERGAGLVDAEGGLTAQELVERLRRLLDDPSFERGAAELRRDFLMAPRPTELVPALEELADAYRN